MLLEGLHIPVTTPFHPDGRLALHKLASNITRYSKTPATGMIVLGPSAEPTLLSDDETCEVLRAAAESAVAEKVLIAGICRDSIQSTLALAAVATEFHYDAILVGIPSLAVSEPALSLRFEVIADRSPIPLLLLSTAARPVALDITTHLANHPNILGLLTANSAATIAAILARTSTIRREVTVTPTFAPVTERMSITAQARRPSPVLISAGSLTGAATAVAEPPPNSAPLRTRTKSVGFQIIASSTPAILESLCVGAVAVAPAFAACGPQVTYEVLAAWKDNDQPLADEKQARLVKAAQLAEATPAALKFACDLNGYFGGQPRLPYLPLTADQRAAIEQAMKPLRN